MTQPAPLLVEPTITLEVEQDDTPVSGNFMDTEDPVADRALEDGILERLNRGDVWAWCCVRVVATLGEFTARSSWLGGCCYHDEAEFRETGGYFDDLKAEAVEDLREQERYAVRVGGTGEIFTLGDSRELCALIFKRWGRKPEAAAAACRRLFQNSTTTAEFMKLVDHDNS